MVKVISLIFWILYSYHFRETWCYKLSLPPCILHCQFRPNHHRQPLNTFESGLYLSWFTQTPLWPLLPFTIKTSRRVVARATCYLILVTPTWLSPPSLNQDSPPRRSLMTSVSLNKMDFSVFVSLLWCIWHFKSIFLSWNNLLHWFPWHHTLIFLLFLLILPSLTSFLLWAHSSLSSQEIRVPEDISPRIRPSHSHPWIQFLCTIKTPEFKFSVRACFLIYLDLFNRHPKCNTCKTEHVSHLSFLISWNLPCPHYFLCRKNTNTYFILSARDREKCF